MIGKISWFQNPYKPGNILENKVKYLLKRKRKFGSCTWLTKLCFWKSWNWLQFFFWKECREF